MALTDQQMTDTRRYLGYPLVGTTMLITDDQDVVYMRFGMVVMSLHKRLTTLSASEESVLINNYLTQLATLEQNILSAADNLDTDEAAVWKHNKNEISDRTALYNQWRKMLCSFIGVAPGAGIGCGPRIVRC